ncbi:hypothetical protein [Desulfogranum japonicum]|uniref:hypothetical protein n=1 Tax=Desulfogranum japonicum TaxID=231447 RepID=UPI000551179A|nr:hypothetical protein [Desulfogranum japonicum]
MKKIKSDENKNIHNTANMKKAISMSIDELQGYYGKLPSRFKLVVDEQNDDVKITLIEVPVLEGGCVQIVFSKEKDEIVKKIVCQ